MMSTYEDSSTLHMTRAVKLCDCGVMQCFIGKTLAILILEHLKSFLVQWQLDSVNSSPLLSCLVCVIPCKRRTPCCQYIYDDDGCSHSIGISCVFRMFAGFVISFIYFYFLDMLNSKKSWVDFGQLVSPGWLHCTNGRIVLSYAFQISFPIYYSAYSLWTSFW